MLDVPGHSAGHVAYWRERDRVLVMGDVLAHMDYRTGLPRLHKPPSMFTPRPGPQPSVGPQAGGPQAGMVCFGHGPPLRDTRRLVEFVASLPE